MVGDLTKLIDHLNQLTEDSKQSHNDIIRQLRGPVLDADKFCMFIILSLKFIK